MLFKNVYRPARCLIPPSSRKVHTTPSLRDRTTPPPTPIAPRASSSPTSRNKSNLPFLPLVAIFCLGTASFYFLTKSRAGQTPTHTYELPDRDPGREQWPKTPRKE